MNTDTGARDFRARLKDDLEDFLVRGQARIPEAESLRVDLHCHDRNSDKPDERLGRMLGVPETWVTTDELLSTLRLNGTDLVTVTNHNNARTCWDLLERGMDVLPGGEFTCTLPDFQVSVHVLAYGFTPAQEERLAVLRKDIYRFVDYCTEHDLVTTLAHPLQFHSPRGLPPMEVMDRLGLLFERFEAVNGQRDSWQNVLTATWVEGMDEEEIQAMAKRARQPVDLFVHNPYLKRTTGGSDDHMAMYAGSTGTILHVPDLAEKRRGGRKLSELALQALREGACTPYGGANEEEKLAAALLDYFCQIVLNMEDPGLLRILLHKGAPSEKALALAVSNGAMELRRHSVTIQFLRMIHAAFGGHAPGFAAKFATNKDFRPLLDVLSGIAKARRKGSNELAREVDTALPALYSHLGSVLAGRLAGKSRQIEQLFSAPSTESGTIVSRMELPSHLRALVGPPAHKGKPRTDGPNLALLADGLPYPLLAASVIAGSQYAAARVLHEKRPFLDAFAGRLGRHRHPHRALWLTDTFGDRNGVSSVLRQMLDEIRLRDLPIDLLVASDELREEPNLRVVPATAVFQTPAYPQPVRVPDLITVQKLFHRGGYDRVVCSTEGPMGLFSLYLKNAFEVPAWFFVHTDWMDFARRTLGWDRPSLSRLRRILRAFYRSYDGLFVLNTQMSTWLEGDQMGIPASRLHTTAHWPDGQFSPQPSARERLFPGLRADESVLLYAGRISEEKGVLDLPSLLQRLRERGVRVRLAFAGAGPQEERLKELVPDGFFLGWCDQQDLAAAYSSADLLVLPSRFDTFGCVVVEAMACALPVAAYAVQGPRDIVEPGRSGILAQTLPELAQRIAENLVDPTRMAALRKGAVERAGDYRPDAILHRLVEDLGLGVEPLPKIERDPSSGDAAGFFGELLEIVQGTEG